MAVAIDGVTTVTHSVNPAWRANHRANLNRVPVVLDETNGSTVYGVPEGVGDTPLTGELAGGCLLAKQSDDTYRPCGDQAATADGTSTNDVTVADPRCFHVSDAIEVRTAGPTQTTAVTVSGSGANRFDLDVTVEKKWVVDSLKLKLTDPGANNATLSATVVDDGSGGHEIDVSLATNGSGTITSTGYDVLAILNGVEGIKCGGTAHGTGAGTTVVVAVSATALRVPYAAIASSRTVSSIDRSTKKITISGAAITFKTGDRIIVVGAHVPAGVLDGTEYVRMANGLRTVDVKRVVDMAVEGDARKDKLIGYHAALSAALRSGKYTDATGTEQTVSFPGFDILDV